jgi:hypothetical protein
VPIFPNPQLPSAFCFSDPCSRILQEGAAIDEHVSFGRKCNTNNNENKEEKTYE